MSNEQFHDEEKEQQVVRLRNEVIHEVLHPVHNDQQLPIQKEFGVRGLLTDFVEGAAHQRPEADHPG